jgi:hypothetical protein
MTVLTNITAGTKGVHAKDGSHHWIEPGASSPDIDLGDATINDEWFVTGDKGLSSLSVTDLKALAGSEGVDLGDATKKADIVAAIELHREAAAA